LDQTTFYGASQLRGVGGAWSSLLDII
jgi:hypothetical protein